MFFRYALVSISSFVAGICCMLAWRSYEHSDAQTVARHWAVVNRYNEYLRDESNYSTDAIPGYHTVEINVDPVPSLYALVSMGELQHADLVFPNVSNSREANLIWLNYTDNNFPDIVYATGDLNYRQFELQGAKPLHVQLWYREEAVGKVHKLIELLQSTTASQEKK